MREPLDTNVLLRFLVEDRDKPAPEFAGVFRFFDALESGQVTALLPGPTDTNFFARAKMLDTPVGSMPKDDPAEVAEQGFEALMRGDRQVVAASIPSKVMGTVARVLPDPIKAAGSRLISVPSGR